jgi:hypothetical protein
VQITQAPDELRLESVIGLGSPDRKGTGASYYIPLPKVAPFAYLHTIFQAATDETLRSACAKLKLPAIWQKFLSVQNGANLFLNSLYLYGAVRPDQPRIRGGNYITMPFSMGEMNSENSFQPSGELLQVGSYRYNGAQLLLNRETGRMLAVNKSNNQLAADWIDVATYLNNELARLNALHDRAGRLLVDERYTVPTPSNPM